MQEELGGDLGKGSLGKCQKKGSDQRVARPVCGTGQC